MFVTHTCVYLHMLWLLVACLTSFRGLHKQISRISVESVFKGSITVHTVCIHSPQRSLLDFFCMLMPYAYIVSSSAFSHPCILSMQNAFGCLRGNRSYTCMCTCLQTKQHSESLHSSFLFLHTLRNTRSSSMHDSLLMSKHQSWGSLCSQAYSTCMSSQTSLHIPVYMYM